MRQPPRQGADAALPHRQQGPYDPYAGYGGGGAQQASAMLPHERDWQAVSQKQHEIIAGHRREVRTVTPPASPFQRPPQARR